MKIQSTVKALSSLSLALDWPPLPLPNICNKFHFAFLLQESATYRHKQTPATNSEASPPPPPTTFAAATRKQPGLTVCAVHRPEEGRRAPGLIISRRSTDFALPYALNQRLEHYLVPDLDGVYWRI
ncbi:hypothetical protein PHJA_001900400 [Phtheirospermum japonicum]|uniref:Uncharacterized protein n=1 Tax=Phtheirospermum japonicum TaxID=374723 RepID=A0A830CNV2_9LAMI|nr:hypothetical protein PHJA_001900400 [Phtheirospermum japonicum]